MIKPPPEILEALKQGDVSTWNAWKEKQEGVVDLRLANLQWADLTGVDLTGAYLQWADLEGANLQEANLLKADLTEANLPYADLTGANLTGANLTEANLPYADLTGANLTGANLREANLRLANLQGANLEGTGIVYRSLRHRSIITPDHAWFGCKGGTHYYWESLTEEEALALDRSAHKVWEHRDELLSLMKECKEKGWPSKGDNDDKATI